MFTFSELQQMDADIRFFINRYFAYICDSMSIQERRELYINEYKMRHRAKYGVDFDFKK